MHFGQQNIGGVNGNVTLAVHLRCASGRLAKFLDGEKDEGIGCKAILFSENLFVSCFTLGILLGSEFYYQELIIKNCELSFD